MSAVFVLILGGCGPARPARVLPPAFSPADVTKCVLELADHDRNGTCSLDELTVVPGLKAAVAELDTDKDGGLSEQELLNWLTALRQSRVAAYGSSARILQRGEPVPGLRVEIIPERCMGNNVKAAEGITDESGIASLLIPTFPIGAHPGIYRVQITGKDAAGQPIPAKYSSNSPLGLIMPAPTLTTTFDLD